MEICSMEAPKYGGVIDLDLQDETLDSIFQNRHIDTFA